MLIFSLRGQIGVIKKYTQIKIAHDGVEGIMTIAGHIISAGNFDASIDLFRKNVSAMHTCGLCLFKI